MSDMEKAMSWLEGLTEPDWRECYSDSEVQETARQALDLIDELLKEQENEYEKGFNDAMQDKRELMYEGVDGKWHKKDW